MQNPVSPRDNIKTIKEKVEPLILCSEIADSFGSAEVRSKIEGYIRPIQNILGEAKAKESAKELRAYLSGVSDFADPRVQSNILSLFSQMKASFSMMGSNRLQRADIPEVEEGKGYGTRKTRSASRDKIHAADTIEDRVNGKADLQGIIGKTISVTDLVKILHNSYQNVYMACKCRRLLIDRKGVKYVKVPEELVAKFYKGPKSEAIERMAKGLDERTERSLYTKILGKSMPITGLVNQFGVKYTDIYGFCIRQNITSYVEDVLCTKVTHAVIEYIQKKVSDKKRHRRQKGRSR